MYCEFCGGHTFTRYEFDDDEYCDTCPAVYYGGKCINKEEVEKEQLEEIETLKKILKKDVMLMVDEVGAPIDPIIKNRR